MKHMKLYNKSKEKKMLKRLHEKKTFKIRKINTIIRRSVVQHENYLKNDDSNVEKIRILFCSRHDHNKTITILSK